MRRFLARGPVLVRALPPSQPALHGTYEHGTAVLLVSFILSFAFAFSFSAFSYFLPNLLIVILSCPRIACRTNRQHVHPRPKPFPQIHSRNGDTKTLLVPFLCNSCYPSFCRPFTTVHPPHHPPLGIPILTSTSSRLSSSHISHLTHTYTYIVILYTLIYPILFLSSSSPPRPPPIPSLCFIHYTLPSFISSLFISKNVHHSYQSLLPSSSLGFVVVTRI